MASAIEVCGLAYSKKMKALLVDYRDDNKQKCKKLTFVKLSGKHTINSITQYLKQKYPTLLNSDDPKEAALIYDALSFAVEDLIIDFQREKTLMENLHEVDLNRVSEEDNRLAKRKMDEVFEAKRLKPGDPGFVWDKRVDFSPPEEVCDWDE